jgi:uncharacterized protein YciI
MYALICFDRPDSAPLRDKQRAAHQEFLQKNPFRRGGVYESVAVRAFKQVFPPK